MGDLVERLRSLVILDEVGSDNPLGRDAADRIEALERENAELRASLTNAITDAREDRLTYSSDRLKAEIKIAKEQARREALEEAAKVAERCGRPVGASDGCTYVPGTSVDAAKAIRSLIQAEREEE